MLFASPVPPQISGGTGFVLVEQGAHGPHQPYGSRSQRRQGGGR